MDSYEKKSDYLKVIRLGRAWKLGQSAEGTTYDEARSVVEKAAKSHGETSMQEMGVF